MEQEPAKIKQEYFIDPKSSSSQEKYQKESSQAMYQHTKRQKS